MRLPLVMAIALLATATSAVAQPPPHNVVLFVADGLRPGMVNEQTAPAMSALLAVTDRVGIVINKVNLAKHALYEYGDYGDYYSRYNAYYGANTQASRAAQPATYNSGIAKLKRIVPRVK